MRYDEINLNQNGILTIQGVTGGDRQVIQYSSNTVIWGTASKPIDKDSYITILSNNTVVLQSTDTPEDNGILLESAVQIVQDLSLEIGANETNRATLLLMPGVYHVVDEIIINRPHVDIIGFSGDPKSVIISNGPYSPNSLFYYQNNSDCKLENLTLENTFGLNHRTLVGGGDTYLKWRNLILKGNGFYQANVGFSVDRLLGEYKDIVSYVSYFAVSNGDSDAVFENIKIYNPFECFTVELDVNMTGTFRNIYIEIGTQGLAFCQKTLAESLNGTISGNFENITIVSAGSFLFNAVNLDIRMDGFKLILENSNFPIFYARNNLMGVYRNIIIYGLDYIIFQAKVSIVAQFENLEIYGSNPTIYQAQLFTVSEGTTITATFSNILIETPGSIEYVISCVNSQNAVPIASTMILYINNFDFNSTNTNYFIANSGCDSITGEFKNMNLNQVGTFISAIDIRGTFENIVINYSNGNAFSSEQTTIGKFKNIEIRNILYPTYYFTSSNLSLIEGDFENIFIKTIPGNFVFDNFQISGNNTALSGRFKNIRIGDATNLFRSDNIINCEMENIEFGEVSNSCFYSNSTIRGTFSDIRTNYTQNNIFTCEIGDINSSFKNVYLENISRKAFEAGGDLKGNYQNIRIGDRTTSDAICFRSYGNLYGNFNDIRIGDGFSNITNDFISTDANILGKFENITLGNSCAKSFIALNGEISGIYRNIYIPPNSENSAFKSLYFSYSTIFENVQCYNRLGTFSGKMFNSIIVNSQYDDAPDVYEPFVFATDISRSEPIVIEDTDFYTVGKVEVGPSLDYAFGSVFWNQSGLGNLSDVHILNCGLVYGFPKSKNNQDNDTNLGIDPIGGTFSNNVYSIPEPK